jgi:hypothetical protein
MNIDSIWNLCNLVSRTFNLTTFFINPNGDISFESKNNQAINPLYKNENLIDISLIVFHMFNGILLSSETVMSKNKELAPPINKEEQINLIVSKNLQTGTFHHDPILEKKTFKYH